MSGGDVLDVVAERIPREIRLTVCGKQARYVRERTATREVRSYGDGIGTCHCSECQWAIGVFDTYCSSCGARLVETHYERV